MSGSADFLLKVLAYSMDHFSELSMQRILKFPGCEKYGVNIQPYGHQAKPDHAGEAGQLTMALPG